MVNNNLVWWFFAYPSEKSWSEWKSVGMMKFHEIPNWMETYDIQMFQTTNQSFNGSGSWLLVSTIQNSSCPNISSSIKIDEDSKLVIEWTLPGEQGGLLITTWHYWIPKEKRRSFPTMDHVWFLTCWWFQSLWKILVSWDDSSQYMETKPMFQTTNQPTSGSCLILTLW